MRKAKSQRLRRENESEQDRESRLTNCRLRMSMSRSNESSSERNERLQLDRTRHSLLRAQESLESRDHRLENDRIRHAISRSLESSHSREQRLENDRRHHQNQRELESQEQHDIRVSEQCDRYHESQRQRIERLSQLRESVSIIRQSETNFYRERRLDSARQTTRALRDIETEANRRQRLNNDQIRRTNRRNIAWREKHNSGFNYDAQINYSAASEIGPMNVCCNYCKALRWKDESKAICCSSGKVRLNSIQQPPEPLKSLLCGEHDQSQHFLNNIRHYNSAFQMTSFGAKEIHEGNYMPTFKIQGQVYHLIGSLLPVDNASESFLQIYFISDYVRQRDARLQCFPNLNPMLVESLQSMLIENNNYIHDFKTALQFFPPNSNENDYKIVINADRRPSAEHPGRHNEPTTNEVSVLLANQDCDKRDIILRRHDNQLQRISETHRSYDALQYPLIFVYGEDGYNFAVYQIEPNTGQPNFQKKVSALQYYCYRLMIRENEHNHLHNYKQLFNQYLVDVYAKIETERLIFIRTNQKKLRVENYIHLQDAIHQNENVEDLGQLVILPSSFTGGPRYMHQRTQDAFCYVRKYGRPDLFITFTTNPKWDEITNELFTGQLASDRHDVVSRVFKQKLKKLMNLLVKVKIFGCVRCFMYSVEWQKRGLPHAHILIWLETKIRAEQIDDVIRAELPDQEVDLELFDVVKTHMVHGPCGSYNPRSPCMKNGICSKRFPKSFTTDTITGEDGYPFYRRRSPENGGIRTTIQSRTNSFDVDNRWIVPFSPVLSRTFKAHINVELCSSIKSIKYICKYVNKGSDLAVFGIQNANDEVTSYQNGRYISTSEAVWRMLSFSIHERFPAVIHLDIHLENGQRVYFDPSNARRVVENPRNTTLMAFFDLCNNDEFAASLLYEEIPGYYTFNKQNGTFQRRRRGTPVEGHPGIFYEHTLGRIYTIHPNNRECYYLRLLLTFVKGPTSFESLKRVNGILHPTYQAACLALGLLEGDNHWCDTLTDASISSSASKLRELFAIILVFCNVSNPTELWDKFKDHFTDDYVRDFQRHYPDADINTHLDIFTNRALFALQDVLLPIGGNSLSHYGLPSPQATDGIDENLNREYIEHTNFDPVELQNTINHNEPRLNDEQNQIYRLLIDKINANAGGVYFLDAPGGTGKTFLINLLLAKIRAEKKIAIAVASSGIAATLLPGGKTAHSMFKIPLDLDRTENPVCNIPKNSLKAKVLQDCVIVVWDECTMANKMSIEAVNRTMQDIRSNNLLFGGVVFLFAGDFRQILPVVTKGTRADEINACLKRSVLWRHCKKLHLKQNMRAHSADSEFSKILLDVGEGKCPEVNSNHDIELPTSLCQVVADTETLIHSIYDDIHNLNIKEDSWLCDRSILAPTNDQVTALNQRILDKLSGESQTYLSINTVCNPDEVVNYPTEFLNSIIVPGLPPHKLELKVGVPIMLLRNLNPPKLCNGTRLRVVSLQRNVIEGRIISGCGKGEIVFIPRIPIIPSNFAFEFKRLQFPINVSFAMTISKSQGQTLSKAGIDLTKGCFTHGQLYVACSRARNASSVVVLAQENRTPNIVYKEIFQ